MVKDTKSNFALTALVALLVGIGAFYFGYSQDRALPPLSVECLNMQQAKGIQLVQAVVGDDRLKCPTGNGWKTIHK